MTPDQRKKAIEIARRLEDQWPRGHYHKQTAAFLRELAQPPQTEPVPTAPLPEPDFTLDGDTTACYYAETVTRLLAAQAAQARGTK